MRLKKTASWLCLALIAAAADAETIIFTDGSFVEGKITLETSRSIRVQTRFGTRRFSKKKIDEIIQSVERFGADASEGFHNLPDPWKAVLNARADYKLGHYERALKRLEPFEEYEQNKAVRIQMDWLLIEIQERLGHWETARRLLTQKLERGTPREQVRARAHLDIFEVNPEYDLRYVGEKHARHFLRDEELRNRARESGSLKDAELMRRALEEYCEQLLGQDKLSVKAFADRLDLEATYSAVKELPPVARLEDSLPYMDDLKKAEASIYKAQSVLGDYGKAFEVDLIRTELVHLGYVLSRLEQEISEASPGNFDPPADSRTGRLTAAGRQQWRERCDRFLEVVRPAVMLMDYMADKAEAYPRRLRTLNKLLEEAREQLDAQIKAVKRARNRTHA